MPDLSCLQQKIGTYEEVSKIAGYLLGEVPAKIPFRSLKPGGPMVLIFLKVCCSLQLDQ